MSIKEFVIKDDNGRIYHPENINEFKNHIKKYHTIDGVGDNQKIINSLFHQTSAHFLSSPSAYFLYNYASYTYPPDKCFLFC